MKIKLLCHHEYWSNATAFFLEKLYSTHFDITIIDPSVTYDPNTSVVYAHYITANQWIQSWQDRGFKIVIDHLWDPWYPWENKSDQLVLRSDGWFCIANEALWYTALGLNRYTAKNTNTKDFLMLMNRKRPHRDQIWSKIQSQLSNSIYSYHGNNIKLQGSEDIDPKLATWQRHVNPDWYDNTKYSLVVETSIDDQPMVHSEKALKPFAFKHPMIVWGPPGYLQWLRTWGFKTFSHCIDESYDNIQNHQQRLEKIIQEIARLNATPKDYFEDSLTREILDHNYNRFYDVNWAQQQFQQQLVNVIKEFAKC